MLLSTTPIAEDKTETDSANQPLLPGDVSTKLVDIPAHISADTSAQLLANVPVQQPPADDAEDGIGLLNISQDVSSIPESTHPELDMSPSLVSTSGGSEASEEISKDPSNLEKVIADQDHTIRLLMKVLERKDKQLMEMSRLVESNENLMKKNDALRKKSQRLSSKLSRESFTSRLSPSQQAILKRDSNRGVKWSPDLIREGLILKMRCGTSGYAEFVKRVPLLPSVRALQEAVRFIKFDCGLFEEVFDVLEAMAEKSTDMERDCQIVLDEMAIEEGEKYDNSLKKWVGKCTFPSHTGFASKALVIMLAGISKRWKISVAVYLTNQKEVESDKSKKTKGAENTTGKALEKILNSIIIRTEQTGLKVCSITSDMGPDNMAMWKAYGITGGKNQPVKSSFQNPARPDSQLFVLPDAIHLFKSIKTAMESNEIIVLPNDIVQEENLPSRIVSYQHIDDLYEHEEYAELKVAFRLKEENIHCKKQFAKMSVGTSRAVICHRTGVALNLYAEETHNSNYQTTAWFVLFLNTFFELVTARHESMAISKKKPEVYKKAVNLISKMVHVFDNMKIGTKGHWKPVQRGMKILCASLLGLQEYFLVERKYRYLMLGRFLQDCIENLFSVIRLKQPVPSASSFLQCLKVITLAQYSVAVKGASYDYDECEAISSVDFLAEAQKRAQQRATHRFYESLEELYSHPVRKLTDKDLQILSEWEQFVLYDMCGSVIAGLKTSNTTLCDVCLQAVKWQEKGVHPKSVIVEMKEFTALRTEDGRQLQIYVSDEVFKAIWKAEVTFRFYRNDSMKFKNADVEKYFVDNLMYVWTETKIPNCHDICRKILHFFIRGRLRRFGMTIRHSIKEATSKKKSVVKLNSKSAAMREAADKIQVTSTTPASSHLPPSAK